MIDKKIIRHSRLAREILMLIGKSAAISFVLFFVLITVTNAVAEEYCFYNDIVMTEFDWIRVNGTIFFAGASVSCICFCVLFLSQIYDRINYIGKIAEGIETFKSGEMDINIPLEGNNELTDLAAAVNEMAQTKQKLWEQEQELAREKEELIRSLSHDIRTPLTSIMAYSDYLFSKEHIQEEEYHEYMLMISKKAQQIKELTDVLLDGANRKIEQFDDGKLLFYQLCMELQEELDEQFDVKIDFSDCQEFSGEYDVAELRRIFDNLISNIQKYADKNSPVYVTVKMVDGQLQLCQSNNIGKIRADSESYHIGLASIQRIAGLYGGTATSEQKDGIFTITITFGKIL